MNTIQAVRLVENIGEGSAWERSNAAGTWVRMTDEEANYALEVLPPIYFPGGFAVSEPATHTAEGVPTYFCVTRFEGFPYGCDRLTIAQAREQVDAIKSGRAVKS